MQHNTHIERRTSGRWRSGQWLSQVPPHYGSPPPQGQTETQGQSQSRPPNSRCPGGDGGGSYGDKYVGGVCLCCICVCIQIILKPVSAPGSYITQILNDSMEKAKLLDE